MRLIKVIVRIGTGQEMDVEIPAQISADRLIGALHEGLHLPGKKPSFIRVENPVAMLCGSTTVEEYELHQGSILYL